MPLRQTSRALSLRIQPSGGALLNLSQWEKKMLRISGNLRPGDNFHLTAPVVVGPCKSNNG